MAPANLPKSGPPQQDDLVRLRAEGWCERMEERHETSMSAKLIRASGASRTVTISDISSQGMRLDGIEGLTIGERVLIVLPDHRVVEVKVRWALGDQAGGRIVD